MRAAETNVRRNVNPRRLLSATVAIPGCRSIALAGCISKCADGYCKSTQLKWTYYGFKVLSICLGTKPEFLSNRARIWPCDSHTCTNVFKETRTLTAGLSVGRRLAELVSFASEIQGECRRSLRQTAATFRSNRSTFCRSSSSLTFGD